MGLYKDPDGKNITFKTTTLGDNLTVNDNATVKSDLPRDSPQAICEQASLFVLRY